MSDTTRRPVFLAPKEAAAELRLSIRTLTRYRNERRGPAFHKIGGRVLYRNSDLYLWIERQRFDPEAIR